jgi:hypothetical protein
MVGVDTAVCGSADDGFDASTQIAAPLGSEAAGDFAVGRPGSQLAFRAVVIGGCSMGTSDFIFFVENDLTEFAKSFQ